MAYTAYRTWTTGEIVTAALMNEQVRDNGLLTAPAIMTGAGDLIYSSAANTPVRLPKDTNSTRVLTNTGTSNVPAWAQVTLTSGVTGTLPVANGGTNLTSLGSGVATFMGTPSSANLRGALTDETGTGAAVFATSPTLVTPALGTPSAAVLTNATGLPEAGLAVSNSPTNGYMLTAQSGDAGGMTWAAAGGGGAANISCRLTASGTQSLPNATMTPINFNGETFDYDDMHYTSAANLSGTVTKTGASTGLVGSGCSFTTELSVGQVIKVPGTADEKRVVTVISDNDNLTVSTAFTNSASGQTTVRVNSAVVARTAGVYVMLAQGEQATNGTGVRYYQITLNDSDIIANHIFLNNSDAPRYAISTAFELAQWDFVEFGMWQNSGGSLNSTVTADRAPRFFVGKLPG